MRKRLGNEMQKGYENTYNWVIGLLKDHSFSGSAKRLGLEQPGENRVLVHFLGRIYRVTHESIELIEQTPPWDPGREGAEYDIKSVLGYYVLSDPPGEPSYEYCCLGQFCGGVFRESEGYSLMINRRFSDIFGNNYKKLGNILGILGAEYEPGSRAGKYIWRYLLLPKLPVQFVFYEGDDEFPSKLQILYDKTAIRIFNFEQLAVLHSLIMSGIISLGKEQ